MQLLRNCLSICRAKIGRYLKKLLAEERSADLWHLPKPAAINDVSGTDDARTSAESRGVDALMFAPVPERAAIFGSALLRIRASIRLNVRQMLSARLCSL
jgi:hypothetical protein